MQQSPNYYYKLMFTNFSTFYVKTYKYNISKDRKNKLFVT